MNLNYEQIKVAVTIVFCAMLMIPVGLASRAPNTTAVELTWDDLLELNLKTGKVGPKLGRSVGKLVKLPGFMVALDDIGQEKIGEFLFVPYAQACIHVPAPPPNQIVHARVKPGKRVLYDSWQPFWAYGVIKIDKSKSDLAEASFRMVVHRLEPYTEEFLDY